MDIVVCMKAVPSTTEVKMDPVTKTIVRDGGEAVVKPFDASALEVALQLKESAVTGACTVGVLSMGIPATESLLRDAIARGADRATLLTDRAFAGADTLATTYALSCGIRIHGALPDLIICGKMAVDGDTAQIGPELAGTFGIPCVTDVSRIVSFDGSSLTVVHGADAGAETVRIELPAVITVSKDIAQLRMPSIAGIRAAEQAEVTVLSAADAAADVARCGLSGSPTQVVRSFVPQRERDSIAVTGDAGEQARKLVALFKEVA